MWRVLLFVFCLGFLGFQISATLGLLLWGLMAVLWVGWLVLLFWQILRWKPPSEG